MFFLGTHRAHWLGKLDIPLFVSRRVLFKRKRLPKAKCVWSLDSGGFTELSMFGKWTLSPCDYAKEVRRYRDEVGGLQWAAQQDWMCEPWIIEKSGLSVQEHQARTVENFLELRSLAPDLPIVPVVQGWKPSDYLDHVRMFRDSGIDLTREKTVGVGSVCRRQNMGEAGAVLMGLQRLGLRNLHGFGFKVEGLQKWGALLQSSDSMAWSFRGRVEALRNPCPEGKRSCSNCMHYALSWREKIIRQPQQLTLAL